MANEYLDDAKESLSFAEADLGVAEHLNKTYHPKPLEIICFHCQQAAEKAVKSITIQMANEFVKWAKLNLDEAENPE